MVQTVGAFRAMVDQGAALTASVDTLRRGEADLAAGLSQAKRTGLLPDTAKPALSQLTGATAIIATGDEAEAARQALRRAEATIAVLSNANAVMDNTAFRAALPDATTAVSAFAEMADQAVKTALATNRETAAVTGDALVATIISTFVALALAVAASLFLALYVSQRGILAPLATLRHQMVRLAEGDTEAPAEAMIRRDEIGAMAATVEVFRANAVKRAEIEREAEAVRAEAQRVAEETAAERRVSSAARALTIDHLSKGLARLAEGDLGCRIETPFAAAHEPMRLRFNQTVDALRETIAEIGERAASIRAETGAMQGSAHQLSDRTATQAAAVEQTAAALGEITRTVGETASRAGEVGRIVDLARQGAEQSSEVVRQSVVAIHRIKQSSDQIAGIVDLIDGIAFQTNLLALNAGVEAARAGESGKGFAVVASEVRDLAQRSARAAKEIEALIDGSGRAVASGVSLAEQAGRMLGTIVGDIRAASSSVDAIAEAAQDQSLSLGEISQAIGALDRNTNMNAAMAEETMAASRQLAEDTMALTRLLARFSGDGLDAAFSRPGSAAGRSRAA